MLKKDIYPLNVLKQTPYKLSFFPITTTFTTISYAFIILYLFAIESFIITNKILCLKISKFYSNSRTKPGRTHTIIIWSHEVSQWLSLAFFRELLFEDKRKYTSIILG